MRVSARPLSCRTPSPQNLDHNTSPPIQNFHRSIMASCGRVDRSNHPQVVARVDRIEDARDRPSQPAGSTAQGIRTRTVASDDPSSPPPRSWGSSGKDVEKSVGLPWGKCLTACLRIRTEISASHGRRRRRSGSPNRSDLPFRITAPARPGTGDERAGAAHRAGRAATARPGGFRREAHDDRPAIGCARLR